MLLRMLLLLPLLLLALPSSCHGLQNGFRLPQLGWNSWNHFGCGVTEQDVRNTADAFVSTGMKNAGARAAPPHAGRKKVGCAA